MNKYETQLIRSSRRLTLMRIFDAPRELVWQAWLTPKYLAQWYGPDGFTITTHEMDARPGGVWVFTMHGPDGRDFPNKIEFLELNHPETLVYRHSGDGDTRDISFSVKITFETIGEQTRLTMQMEFASEKQLERVAKEFGAVEGAKQTLARLALALETFKSKTEDNHE